LNDSFHLFYETARTSHRLYTLVTTALERTAEQHANRDADNQSAKDRGPCFDFNAHV
jgi:hypothetical protein